MKFLRTLSCWLIGGFFMFAGIAHFVSPTVYLPMMPPYLPWPMALIYLSGAAEIAGGAGLLIPRLRQAAAWGLIALLLAIFPANIHMLMTGLILDGKQVPEWVLWVRLPLQFLLVLWIYACGIAKTTVRSGTKLDR
ncbi:MAG: DoxX family protein [Akkermansiaceae bacterium]